MPKRNVNIELLRIVGTMLVVILHVLGLGGVLQSIPSDTITHWGAWFLEICAYCAVNIFALISGYVMMGKTVKIKNILSLWFQVFFYSVLIAGLLFAFIPETRGAKNLIIAFFPVLARQWWYVSAYFGLFLFIPLLNVAINHVSQTTYSNVLIAILIVLCTANRIMPLDSFGLSDGYSMIWLLVMYLFGAYIRKYDLQQVITAPKSLLGYFLAITVTFFTKLVIFYGTKLILGKPDLDSMFVSYNSVTIVLASIFLFLFCLNVKMNSVCQKVVSFFAPVSLSVYLIHTHQLVYKHLLTAAFASFGEMSLLNLLACTLLTAFLIYLVCAVIDLLRIQLFKILHVHRLCEILEARLLRLYAKLFPIKA